MTRPIKIVLSSFFYLVVLNSFSQTITERDELGWMTPKYPPDEEYIEGTRYYHDDFNIGYVFYDGNAKSLQLPLRLNLHNDELEFMKNDSVYAFAEPNRIDKVVIEDEVFVYFDKNFDSNISGFVKIRNTKLPCILTKMRIDFYSEVRGKAFVESKPDRFVRDDDSHYLMKTETEILKVSSVKKLIKLLDDHSQELTEYAKKEKISGSSGENMARILDYYHTLEHNL